jgi:hypothetical protein
MRNKIEKKIIIVFPSASIVDLLPMCTLRGTSKGKTIPFSVSRDLLLRSPLSTRRLFCILTFSFLDAVELGLGTVLTITTYVS